MNCSSFDNQPEALNVIPEKHISTSTGKPLTFGIKACVRLLLAYSVCVTYVVGLIGKEETGREVWF